MGGLANQLKVANSPHFYKEIAVFAQVEPDEALNSIAPKAFAWSLAYFWIAFQGCRCLLISTPKPELSTSSATSNFISGQTYGTIR
jgi:hypothetical protein